MFKKAWCTCIVVVLLIKPIVFLTFLLPAASLDLKVPITSIFTNVNFTRVHTEKLRKTVEIHPWELFVMWAHDKENYIKNP